MNAEFQVPRTIGMGEAWGAYIVVYGCASRIPMSGSRGQCLAVCQANHYYSATEVEA